MTSSKMQTPEDLYGPLFYEIHKTKLFDDDKTFADATAKMHPSIILKTYKLERQKADFNLREFVNEYFFLPIQNGQKHVESPNELLTHIEKLWDKLEKPADNIKSKRSSKIPLPYPYIVPGGRFDEIYYWDSYFTMLGLVHSGKTELIESMVNNFKHLIDTLGHIPNGNRTYFQSRSQPPFYSLMVKLFLRQKGIDFIPNYLPSLIKEYNFWMNGLDSITDKGEPVNRVHKLENKYLLNRYFDLLSSPRQEMYHHDWGLINYSEKKENSIFLDIRAACESGWDFSSRWMPDPKDIKSINTTEILPLDLNCLMWHHEKIISECYNSIGDKELGLNYAMIAYNRKKAIDKFFWNEEKGFYFDYNWKSDNNTEVWSLAAAFPLFFKLCSQEQADKVAQKIEESFLKDGGLVTTIHTTGQQWDAPNGWAPLQWISIKGLLNYGHKALAQEIGARWIKLNKTVYNRTGKMLEKYNVEDINLEGGGGEYPVQDGFGWTNGVFIALQNL